MARSARRASSVTTARCGARSISSARRTPIVRSSTHANVHRGCLPSGRRMRSETPFDFDGDLIGIDAIVVGPTDRAKVRLVLDTGAALTTLVPTVAQAIGYTSSARIAWSVTRGERARLHRAAREDHDTWLHRAFRGPTRRAAHPRRG